ncbi:hypothetical protein PoB_005800700 [Plakobranchus ocellatus]|uniref:C2H2-type domain-containing protein n=1 Tax=Plakobranchus ocellatus TaxID=259542 RepID=A0AAV4CJD4_9GAST|nr:hypothetical protein PoB_005800700 [Plakobranchus ocellatus]
MSDAAMESCECRCKTDFGKELKPSPCCLEGRCETYKLDNLLWRHYTAHHPGTFIQIFHPWTPPKPPERVPCSPNSLCEALQTDALVYKEADQPRNAENKNSFDVKRFWLPRHADGRTGIKFDEQREVDQC